MNPRCLETIQQIEKHSIIEESPDRVVWSCGCQLRFAPKLPAEYLLCTFHERFDLVRQAYDAGYSAGYATARAEIKSAVSQTARHRPPPEYFDEFMEQLGVVR